MRTKLIEQGLRTKRLTHFVRDDCSDLEARQFTGPETLFTLNCGGHAF